MESLLPFYLTIIGTAVVVTVYLLLRRDESFSRNLAKVRVKVDGHRQSRQAPKRTEEELENLSILDWMVGGAVLLFLVLVLSNF